MRDGDRRPGAEPVRAARRRAGRAAPRGSGALGRGLLALIAFAGVTAVLFAQAVPRPTAQAQAMPDEITLSHDAGSSAMFSAPRMTPYRPVTNCLSVRHHQAPPAADVGLYAETSGGLAPHLRMTVEVGDGAAFGQCAGFAGRAVYSGSLADFAVEHHDLASSLPVLQLTTTNGDTAFRFTFELDDATGAQGRTAQATFVWSAPLPSIPSPQPTTDPGPPPRDVPPADSAPPAAEVPPKAGVPPKAEVPPKAGVPPKGEIPSKTGVPPDAADRSTTLLERVLGHILESLQIAGKASTVPIGILALVLLFLAVQNGIDRRDPKLALAPVHARELTFTHSTGDPS